MTPRRRRRWLAPAAIALTALLALAVVGVMVYTADPTRVVALLQKVLRRDLGLSLSYQGSPRLTWWPHAGVALDDYRIDVVATSQPLAWGDALELEVPWRALRGATLEIERIALDGPVVHAPGLRGWERPRSSARPAWPRVASGIAVRGAKWIGSGAPPRVIEGISFEVTPIEPGRELTLTAAWTRGAKQPPLELKLVGVPRDARDGLALDTLSLDLREGETETARFAGAARYASARDWSLRGTLAAEQLPAALATHFAPPDAAPAKSTLTLELGATEDAWRIVANGSLAGSRLDANLSLDALPDVSAPLPVLLESLRRDVHGHARLDRLRVDGIELEGIELGDEPAVDAATRDADTQRERADD